MIVDADLESVGIEDRPVLVDVPDGRIGDRGLITLLAAEVKVQVFGFEAPTVPFVFARTEADRANLTIGPSRTRRRPKAKK